MEVLHRLGRSSIWNDVLLIILIGAISTATGQNGFLSIDCGSAVSYVDEAGISWVPDGNYTSTGKNINNITVYSTSTVNNTAEIINPLQDLSLRYFDDPRSRDCYVLPVQIGETYLLRLTFFYGSLANGTFPISFDVWLDGTDYLNLEWISGIFLYEEYRFEAIYLAPKNTLDVCFVREALTSSAFISALELRPLATGMYAAVLGPNSGVYMYNVNRINCGPSLTGATQFWRYPDDTYDRVWTLFSGDNATHTTNVDIWMVRLIRLPKIRIDHR